MQTLFLLAVCAAPPPQSTLDPAFRRPAPKAGIEETDSPAGVTPKGIKDDRQLAKLPRTTGNAALDELLREAKRTGAVKARWVQEGPVRQWYSATPDGWLKRIPDPTPRREVAAQPFRATYSGQQFRGMECEYDPDHVCNRCGAVQLVIARWNGDGSHSHVCGRCRHSWRH